MRVNQYRARYDKKLKRVHIKYMLVTIPTRVMRYPFRKYYITLITDKFNIITHEFSIQAHYWNDTIPTIMYRTMFNKLRGLFRPYILDSETLVYLDNALADKKDNPLIVYFLGIKSFCKIQTTFLRPIEQLLYSLNRYYRVVDDKTLKEKICKEHDTTKYNKEVTKFWKTFVRRKTCPWITEEIDTMYQTYSRHLKRDYMTIRIIALWFVWSNHQSEYQISQRNLRKNKKILEEADLNQTVNTEESEL